jgi:hypothetical protein
MNGEEMCEKTRDKTEQSRYEKCSPNSGISISEWVAKISSLQLTFVSEGTRKALCQFSILLYENSDADLGSGQTRLHCCSVWTHSAWQEDLAASTVSCSDHGGLEKR